MTIYAIGDIHGRTDLLAAAHDRIAADQAREGTSRSPIVHVGDYADRGPDVPGVIDFLIDALKAGEPLICLAGNHDRMMLGFLDPTVELDPISQRVDWLRPTIGGRMTLDGYGISVSRFSRRSALRERALEVVPAAHLDFLRDLRPSHSAPGLFFAHAGIDPDLPLDQQAEEDLFWIRDRFLYDTRDHGPLIVHGHTPVRAVEHAGNRVNIDTGAGFGLPLSAVAIEGREVFLLTDEGRVRINPGPAGAASEH